MRLTLSEISPGPLPKVPQSPARPTRTDSPVSSSLQPSTDLAGTSRLSAQGNVKPLWIKM